MHIRSLRCVGMASILLLCAGAAVGKLPPASDEAKAKAAEAAAKTAHGNKVASYQLCKSMDGVAAAYQAKAKKDGKEIKPATATDPCADPGAFVYPLPVAVAPVASVASVLPPVPPTPPATVSPVVVAPKK